MKKIMAMLIVTAVAFMPVAAFAAAEADVIYFNGKIATLDAKETTAEAVAVTDGKFVKVADTVQGFKGILEGKYDHMGENSFYMVGPIEEALAKAEKEKA